MVYTFVRSDGSAIAVSGTRIQVRTRSQCEIQNEKKNGHKIHGTFYQK